MSRNELLVLRKTLTDHLERGWIRASTSPGGAPELFVKKPGGGLRFCVDYRALNAITEKDRYRLPPIRDIAFNIKIDLDHQRDEEKTAFRTRFGSYECLVTPFGLQGASAAFQRYINETLGDYLDVFCTAYLDDILIYTAADLKDHWHKVHAVFGRLSKAGLKLDLNKCEFAVKETNYLGFVISLAPVLALYNPETQSVVEADCSGYVLGACLSQFDHHNILRPVAYYSRKLSPAECNYEIHDKELLAVISALEVWRGELVGLKEPFIVLSDDKNLQFFMTSRKLSERFRAGKYSARPDALSRREQDMPHDENDEPLKAREMQLIKNARIGPFPQSSKFFLDQMTNCSILGCQLLPSSPASIIPKGCKIFHDPDLRSLWDRGCVEDHSLDIIYQSIKSEKRTFPNELKLKVAISECELDERGALRFRKRIWVPNWEPLQTALIQKTHYSHITGHPGRDSTYAILLRNFFWPGASSMVRVFCRNCDVCWRSNVLREKKKELLLPLPVPVPDRFHSELSIDFMTDLPAKSAQDPRYLMVITDRLLKSCTLETTNSMAAEDCAKIFLDCHYRFHGFPSHITSERGSNWAGNFWRSLCKLVNIDQRMSTAFHPQTDGSSERMNQEVLVYLSAFISYSQDTTIGLSPFFLSHGYHAEPVQQVPISIKRRSKPEERAHNFVKRLFEAQEYKRGDLIWLNLKNISTPQLSKKLSWVNSKYRVTEVVSPHVVKLDVASGIWPKFHVELLKRDSQDPLPSQISNDKQPPPLINDNCEEEQVIERILRAERKRWGRGFRREVSLEWKQFEEPNWELRANLEETEVLEFFETKYGKGDDFGEDLGARTGTKKQGHISR
ncbi:hypothetical protein K3495_g6222 [Podosphaera aphanis]|nr:hypothetical protein K3495_g6222 [Podosphaera aphanis]